MRGAWLVVVTGCGFQPAAVTGGSGGDDAARDAPRVDAPVDQLSVDAYVCSTDKLTCPNAFVTQKTVCNGGCWVSCQSTIAFGGEAQVAALCTSWGGKLAPIRDANDEACVSQVLFPAQASWIGFEQASGQSAVDVGWSWNSDGVTPTYTHWDPGQPDDFNGSENGQEQCAYMGTAGGWQDLGCAYNGFYRFSCRHD